jgi:23S rRNA (uridine2552-2'-O)-methyltransferase
MAAKGRRRQDHLARKAQAEGYRARSVYKLEELNAKFGLLRGRSGGATAQRVLDLGAAPGSWTQYVVARGASVLAVDIQEMIVPGAECWLADFTDGETIERIAAEGPFDLVLSDAAPATSGNRLVDTSRSEALVESIIANLDRWLHSGGSCAFKIFQGGGEQHLLAEMRRDFERAALHRPKAVRSESFESYLVGVTRR